MRNTTPRRLKPAGRPPASDRCPTCGDPIAAISATEPATHRYRPCGHAVLADHRLVGGVAP